MPQNVETIFSQFGSGNLVQCSVMFLSYCVIIFLSTIGLIPSTAIEMAATLRWRMPI
jgi:hypothetical protein